MKRAQMRVTMELLRQVLHLPESVKIQHISQCSDDFSANRCTLYLEGDAPGMPETPEGNVAPLVVALIKSDTFLSLPASEFVRFE